MKTAVIIVFLGFLLCLSCSKSGFQPGYKQGKATAVLNGSNWTGLGEGEVTSDTANFTFNTYNQYGELRQTVSFNKIPCTVGEYDLHELTAHSNSENTPFAGFYTSASDGDAQEDVYFTLQNELYESNLTVAYWDAAIGELGGTFNAFFAIKPILPKKNPTNPDTIFLVNGQFSVTLY